ncbi:hypothetical protein MAR_033577 [Mya arenaria]|uniref:Uncharacterized protein n=1 Tax=Mya arenaria TaxID=6604 RepID=A0ABY7GA88_MYAAR|nr:hypothetical protein MAR_033577 [Mya arenaria]
MPLDLRTEYCQFYLNQRRTPEDDRNAVILAKAANNVREQVDQKSECFVGSFENACQDKSVPQSLKSLVSMILRGPTIQ